MKINSKNQKFLSSWEHLLSVNFSPNRNGHLIFGVQKSGTSVIANALAYCSKRSLTLDHKSLWPTLQLQESSLRAYVSRQFERHPISIGTTFIKEPCMTFRPEIFKEHRPNKSVLIIRNPLDTARSILNRLDVPLDSQRLEVNSIPRAWRGLFIHSSKNEPPFIRAIKYWCMLMDKPFWHDQEIKWVHYEDFLNSPDDVVRAVLEFLELKQRRPAADIISTQIQPKGKNRGQNIERLIPPGLVEHAQNLSNEVYYRFVT